MVYGNDLGTSVISACAVMAAWFFGLPYLLALASETDSTGRLSALTASATSFGQALAPAAAAAVVGGGNFRAIGWLAAGTYLVCLMLVSILLLRVQRPVSNTSSNLEQSVLHNEAKEI